MTGRSIEFAMEEAFTPLYGARKDEDAVQKILIVLTDGRLVVKSLPGIHAPLGLEQGSESALVLGTK